MQFNNICKTNVKRLLSRREFFIKYYLPMVAIVTQT